MRIEETELKDVYIILPNLFTDDRGFFLEIYKDNIIKSIAPEFSVVQENMSFSKKNVFRGLHFQEKPYEQAKLVQCIHGCIIDIAVDIRPQSPQYNQYIAVELSSENKKQLFIPRGFAHAFFVKSDSATIVYRVDNIYDPSSERTISFLDKDININYDKLGINLKEIILSDKDKNAMYSL